MENLDDQRVRIPAAAINPFCLNGNKKVCATTALPQSHSDSVRCSYGLGDYGVATENIFENLTDGMQSAQQR